MGIVGSVESMKNRMLTIIVVTRNPAVRVGVGGHEMALRGVSDRYSAPLVVLGRTFAGTFNPPPPPLFHTLKCHATP